MSEQVAHSSNWWKDNLYSIWLPLILVIINLIYKGIGLVHNSIAGDEPFSIYHAQMDVYSIITQLSTGNNPPLFEIILHYWIGIFGISPWSVRFPSLIFSGITIWFIYKLLYKHANTPVAILASGLFIFSNYFIFFSHEARVYSFIGMLTAISIFSFSEIISGKKNIKIYILLILSNALLIYAHYFGFFVLISQFLFLLFSPTLLKRVWKELLFGMITLILLYSPNIPIFFTRFFDSSSNGTWVQGPQGIESIYNMLWKFCNEPLVTVVAIIILVSGGAAAMLKKEKSNYPIRFIVFSFLFIFLFMFGISYKIPMFMDRYVMPSAVPFYMVLSLASYSLIQKKYYKHVIPAIIFVLFAATSNPWFSNGREAKDTVLKVSQIITPNSLVYICPPWFDMNFVYYYDKECYQDYDVEDIKKNMYECMKEEGIFFISNYEEMDTALINKSDRMIFVDAGADFSFPENNILNYSKQFGDLENQYSFPEIYKIYEFKMK